MYLNRGLLITVAFLISTSHVMANNCNSLLVQYPNANEVIFYSSSNGLKQFKASGGIPDDIIDDTIFYMRSLVRAPGGVLVVKSGRDPIGSSLVNRTPKDRTVTLERGNLKGKKVLECSQTPQTSKFYKKYKSAIVRYDTYQAYANARESDAKNLDADDFEKLKAFHFAFKNRKTSERNANFPCVRTDKGHNRVQSSLVRSETGSQSFTARATRILLKRLFKESFSEKRAKLQNWKVALLPYDQNDGYAGQACIKVTIPNIETAQYLRINDLESRAGGQHTSDRGWDNLR